jgi:hypothetical protein
MIHQSFSYFALLLAVLPIPSSRILVNFASCKRIARFLPENPHGRARARDRVTATFRLEKVANARWTCVDRLAPP